MAVDAAGQGHASGRSEVGDDVIGTPGGKAAGLQIITRSGQA
jgi:hypothetical protein